MGVLYKRSDVPVDCAIAVMRTMLNTVKTRTEGAVLFAEIAATPMNLGAHFFSDNVPFNRSRSAAR